jgi:stage II sporulation protein D
VRTAAGLLAAVGLLLAVGPGRAGAASSFVIEGGGYGHGIGMSQYGAYGYALHGKRYRWILRHYYRGTRLGHTDPKQTVRVLLSTGPAAFAGATGAAGKTLNPSLTYTVRALPSGEVGVFDLSGKRMVKSQPPLIATGPGPLAVAGLGSYRGSLEFRPDGAGGIQTVDAVGLDDYVRGVIAAEMPSKWSPQALKVQAVAARTYAITTSVGGNGFDLYPDTRSQMYGGVAAETPATDAAVAATRGQVVTYHGGPVVTYFFSSSGGHTASIEDVWPGSTPEPWLRGVPDRYDGVAHNPHHRWGATLSLPVAAAKLGSLVKGSFVGIKVTDAGSSDHVVAAKVIGTRGSTRVTGQQLQQAFGLLTNYATFATFHSRIAWGTGGGTIKSRYLVDLVPLVKAVINGATPRLTGTVFPAPRRLSVQVSRHGAWVPAGLKVKVSARGRYAVVLPGSGTYRIVAAGLAGPPITVG